MLFDLVVGGQLFYYMLKMASDVLFILSGEVSMEKVHVKRYVAGKRPEWAADESESDDEDDKVMIKSNNVFSF